MSIRGVNKVIILGNLGNDPEMKEYSGKTLCNISVATSERRKSKTGEYEDFTQWHRIVFFGKLADIALKYLHKGSKVYVEGSLNTKMVDKNGEKQYYTSIIANTLQMLDSKKDGQQGERNGNVANTGSDGFYDNDVPF